MTTDYCRRYFHSHVWAIVRVRHAKQLLLKLAMWQLVTNMHSSHQLSVSTSVFVFSSVSALVVFHASCSAQLSRNSSLSETSSVTSSTDSTMTSWSRKPTGSAAQLRRVDRRTGVTTSFWGLSSSLHSLTLPSQQQLCMNIVTYVNLRYTALKMLGLTRGFQWSKVLLYK